MDLFFLFGFPLNLIMAVATASATIFLGFLPTRDIKSSYFAREVFLAVFPWIYVASTVNPHVFHYYVLIAIFCAGSWWKFRADRALGAKMWLSLCSGLGISIGVMLLLVTTPAAFPKDLPQPGEGFLLASIYTGGAIVGLAYVCFSLAQKIGPASGVTNVIVRRYCAVLLALSVVRPMIVLANLTGIAPIHGVFDLWESPMTLCVLCLTVIVLPTLAFVSWRLTEFGSRIGPGRPLAAMVLVGLLAEILARIEVL